jgi:hypothetical protein
LTVGRFQLGGYNKTHKDDEFQFGTMRFRCRPLLDILSLNSPSAWLSLALNQLDGDTEIQHDTPDGRVQIRKPA